MKWGFSHETKASTQLSQCGEWNYGAQSLKEWELLYESMFIPVERRTLIKKLEEKEVFLMKPKHRYHLPQ